MFYPDHRDPAQRYQERPQEAELERRGQAVLRARRHAAGKLPAVRLPGLGRLFGRQPAAPTHA